MADLDNEQVLAPEPVVQPQENTADVLNDPVLNPEPQVSQQTDDPLLQQQQIEQEQQVLAEDEAADKAEMARRIDERLSFSADPNRADGGITDEQRVEAAEAIRAEDAAAQEAEIDQIDAESAQLAERVAKRRELIARAEASGAPISEDPVLDSIIAEQDKKKGATDEDLQSALEPTVEEVEAAAAPIRQEKAAIAAQEKEMLKEQEKENRIENKAQELEKKVAEEPADTFWGRQSTLSKILMGVSIAAGTIDQFQNDTESNPGIQLLEKAMEQDFAQQRITAQEKAAKRAEAYKRMDMMIKAKSAGIKDQATLHGMEMASREFKLKEAKVRAEIREMERQKESALSLNTEGGMTPEEYRINILQNPDLKPEEKRLFSERTVTVDGKVYQGINKKAAEQANKTVASTQKVNKIIDDLDLIFEEAGTREVTNIPGWKTAADQARTFLGIELKNVFELGVLAGPDMDLVNDAMGLKDGQGFLDAFKTNEAKMKALRGLRKFADDKREIDLAMAGVKPPKDEIKSKMNVLIEKVRRKTGRTMTNREALKQLAELENQKFLSTPKSQGGPGLSSTQVNKAIKGDKIGK